MFRKTFRLMFCILFSIVILAPCAVPTPAPTVTPIPPSPMPTQPALVVKPGLIYGKVDVGGRRLYIFCMGEGSPTVIFETGW
jgi:hypothetical protein